MVANKLIFKDAEKARDAILDSQKKEIENLYKDWASELDERAKYYSHKTAPSYAVYERQSKELMKQMEATSQQVANEVYSGVKKNIYTVADSVVQQNNEWLKSLGFESGTIDAAFNYVPDEIVRNIITGQIYDSGWSLSKRIWSDNEDTMKQAHQIVAGGVAQNKPMYEIAKDLEKYVSPSAAKPWNLRAPDGKKIYPKDVDYNAQRLGRTLVQHGYQQSFVATTQKNPFIIDYIWIANGSRVCEICSDRNGRHYPKDDLPLDHPNGMCTMVPDVVEDLTGQLADWFNSEDGTYPEIDEFSKNFGYEPLQVATDGVTKQVDVSNWLDTLGKQTEEEMLSYERKLFANLTEEQEEGIHLYTEASGDMNDYYRLVANTGNEKFASEYIAADVKEKMLSAQGAISEMSFDKDVVLRRGTDLGDLAGWMDGDFFENKEKLEGMELDDLKKMFEGSLGKNTGFTSTSSIADRGFEGDVEVIYSLPANTKGAGSIMGLSEYGRDEGEVLLAPGMKMEIVRIEESDGNMMSAIRIYMKVLGL